MVTPIRPLRVDTVPRPTYRPRPQSLAQDFGGLARRLLRSVPTLSESDRQFLKDMQRERYPMRSLDRVLALAARSENPAHRFGAPEIVRAHITRRTPALRLVTADVLDGEDDSNSAFDKATRRWVADPSESNRQAAVEAGEQQYAHTRLVLDMLATHAPRGGAA